MQRTIVMVRHAKSSWANPLQSDFDRPLNDRGKQDAPTMGGRLKALGVKPDLIISSTAKRTRQTAKNIAEAIGYDLDSIKWEEKLYHCIPSVFEELIYELDDAIGSVLIIAHNPGITDFVNQLSPDFCIPTMPTCGVVGAHADLEEWSNFGITKKTIFLAEYPQKNDNT